MKITGGLLAALFVCALQGSASAQAPPPPAGGGGPAAPGAMTKYRWDAGLFIGIPQGDFDDISDTSIGISGAVGYNVNPKVSVHVSLRYILVNSEIDGLDLSYYDLGVGGRYTIATSGTITPYVEAELLYATFSASGDGFDSSESDPAVLGRAGGIYKWRPNMDIIFFGSYTIVFVDEDESGFEDGSWLELGGGFQGYF